MQNSDKGSMVPSDWEQVKLRVPRKRRGIVQGEGRGARWKHRLEESPWSHSPLSSSYQHHHRSPFIKDQAPS